MDAEDDTTLSVDADKDRDIKEGEDVVDPDLNTGDPSVRTALMNVSF
jgi:hypothetical protein